MSRNKGNIDQIILIGISINDAIALQRISRTLHIWHEHECNGFIQRDGDAGDGVPYWYSQGFSRKLYRAQDRERGALKRLGKIMARYPELRAYVQGDPRGCALYLLRPNDVPAGKDADAYYSRGIPVY